MRHANATSAGPLALLKQPHRQSCKLLVSIVVQGGRLLRGDLVHQRENLIASSRPCYSTVILQAYLQATYECP